MIVWAVYDIKKDKMRGKIARLCKQRGLYRVQKSVFLGTMEPSRIDELAQESSKLMDLDVDSLYIFPVCQADFKRVILLGQAFDKKLVNDEVKALFL